MSVKVVVEGKESDEGSDENILFLPFTAYIQHDDYYVKMKITINQLKNEQN